MQRVAFFMPTAMTSLDIELGSSRFALGAKHWGIGWGRSTVADSVADSVANCIADSIADPVADSITESSTKPSMKSSTALLATTLSCTIQLLLTPALLQRQGYPRSQVRKEIGAGSNFKEDRAKRVAEYLPALTASPQDEDDVLGLTDEGRPPRRGPKRESKAPKT